MMNKYILDIYIWFTEFRLWTLGFMEFLQNNDHQAVKKMKNFHFHFLNCLMIVVLQKLHETQGSQSKFNESNINIKYIFIYYYYIIALS